MLSFWLLLTMSKQTFSDSGVGEEAIRNAAEGDGDEGEPDLVLGQRRSFGQYASDTTEVIQTLNSRIHHDPDCPLEQMLLEYASQADTATATNVADDPFDPTPVDPSIEVALQEQNTVDQYKVSVTNTSCPEQKPKKPPAPLGTTASHRQHQYSIGSEVLTDGRVLGLARAPTFPKQPPAESNRPLAYSQGPFVHQQQQYQIFARKLQQQQGTMLRSHHSAPTLFNSDKSEHDKKPAPKKPKTASEPSTESAALTSGKAESSRSHRSCSLDHAYSEGKVTASSLDGDASVASVSTAGNQSSVVSDPTPSIHRLYELMGKSIASQELLQEWDQQQGLPRSHSWTMMHTSRSRRQILEGRILPKWNGKPLIGEETLDTDKVLNPKRKKEGKKERGNGGEQ